MKEREQDRTIRERMEAMSTLTGGVVFGREEAWDKLQAKMDARPVRRKLPASYRLAAAIALLVISGAAVIFPWHNAGTAGAPTGPQPAPIPPAAATVGQPVAIVPVPAAYMPPPRRHARPDAPPRRAIAADHNELIMPAGDSRYGLRGPRPATDTLLRRTAAAIGTMKQLHGNYTTSQPWPPVTATPPAAGNTMTTRTPPPMHVIHFNDLQADRAQRQLEEMERQYTIQQLNSRSPGTGLTLRAKQHSSPAR